MKTLLKVWVMVFCGMLCACATGQPSWKPVCRHTAYYAAVSVRNLEDVETRIAVGEVFGDLQGHAQAEALIKGKWMPLVVNKDGTVSVGEWDYWFRHEGALRLTPELFAKKYLGQKGG